MSAAPACRAAASVDSGTSRRPRPRGGAGAALAFLVGVTGTAAALLTGPRVGPTPNAIGAEIPAAAAPPSAATAPDGVAAPNGVAGPGGPAVPSDTELHPVTITDAQLRFAPTPEQLGNARTIVDVGRSMGLPPRAWVIAVGTALQESGLHNLGYLGDRNDHDSLGLFQQRPSAGWGTPEQITDPAYAATAFYNRLARVRDWPSLPLTIAAQKVQVSAYPGHYAKHESEAGDIVRALYGVGPYAAIG